MPEGSGLGRPASERRLRGELRRLLHRLDLTPPLDPELLCERVASDRGRPLDLVGRPLPAGLASGVLVALPDRDLIVYQSDVAPEHRWHVVFHELVHLLRGHLGDGGESACGVLRPASGPGREASLYAHPHEWEAETGATILSGWAARTAAAPRAEPPPDEASRRLDSALARRWDWL